MTDVTATVARARFYTLIDEAAESRGHNEWPVVNLHADDLPEGGLGREGISPSQAGSRSASAWELELAAE